MPAFPNSPAPAWFRRAQWKSAYSKRNGVHYVGDDVIIDLTFVDGLYDTFRRTANFDNGTDGASISSANRGSRSLISSVVGTPTYSSTHAYGPLAMRVSSATSYIQWGYDSVADQAGRLYLYATAYPTGFFWLMRTQNVAIFVDTSGKVDLNSGNPFTNAIALNQWVRIEWNVHYDAVSANTYFEGKLFNDPDSVTPTETKLLTGGQGSSNAEIQIGACNATSWGSDIWIDNVVTRAVSYPGIYDPNEPIVNPITYTVRNFYGEIVSQGEFEEGDSWFVPAVPGDGWEPGWYRIYLIGPQSDVDFYDSYGVTNFCVIKSDSHFVTMPAGNIVGGYNGEAPDYVAKGVMGLGTSRLIISDVTTPATLAADLANAELEIALCGTYWTNTGIPDTQRPSREMWCTFPGSESTGDSGWKGGVDSHDPDGLVSGKYGRFFAADGTLDGSQIFITISAGTNPDTDKIRIYYPDSVTLVETYDNLANATAAKAAVNASSTKVRFFTWNSARPAYSGPTAIGKSYRDGVVSAVSALYALGVTYYEGPKNEPAVTDETAHAMRLFQANVHAGNASAKAIGPCFVSIPPTLDWAEFLDAGGGSYCDEISFHAYNAVTNGDMNLGRNSIQELKDQLAAYGLSGKALWQTESVGAMIPVYGVCHPRRSRKALIETLLFEQMGVPRERDNWWYDTSHGFWNVPAWWENGDGSLEPQVVLGRVLAEETWGKPFFQALDFGPYGNRIYLGSVYQGTAGSTVVLMAPCYMEGASVTLTVSNTTGPLTLVDGMGVQSSVTPSQGRLSISLTDIPMYLELPIGAQARVYSVNDWPKQGVGDSISRFANTREIDGVSYPVIGDDGWMTLYGNGTGIAPTTWSTPPSTVTLLFSSQRIQRVLIWCGPSWQNSGTLVNFDIQTYDGSNWATRKAVDKATPPYFYFGSDDSNSGCWVETYWDEQWVFDVRLDQPVTCTGIRINATEASYGGEPLSTPDFGQGNTNQAYKIQEVAVFPEILGNAKRPRKSGRGFAH